MIERWRKIPAIFSPFGHDKSGAGTALRNDPLQTDQNLAFDNKIIPNMPNFFLVIVKI